MINNKRLITQALHIIVPSVLKPTTLKLCILINRLSKIIINLVIGYQFSNADPSFNNTHRTVVYGLQIKTSLL